MDKKVVDRECFDWSKVKKEAHRLLDERFGESQVELCVEKCKG